MIIKGTSRGNPKQLAAHLLRVDTNERIEILELNSPTDDLGETFREWQTLTTATAGSKGLYHANISPDAGYAMTPAQWERAADVLADKLGLSNQPRTIILHEKDGREHIHVVWQRTDTDTMTLVSDSWNYPAHEEASLALEREFGHEIVPGKHAKRDREQQPEFPRAETNHAEWQQAERAGLDPAERKEQITALFQQSDNGQALKSALAEQGYILAQGDRRDFVIVDDAGEVHSLGRQIKNIKAKDLRAFMADIDRDTLPTVEQARAHTLSQPHDLTPPEPKPEEQPPKLTPAEIAALEQAVTDRHAREAQKLKNLHSAELNQLRSTLALDIRQKLADLDALQEAERRRQHEKMFPERAGLAGFMEDIKSRINPTAAAEAKAERDRKWEALLARQEKKRADKLDTLNQDKKQETDDLRERHAQKLRELKTRSESDLARYVREEERARRLLAAEQERLRRLAEEQARKMDGPDPPSPTR